MLSYKQFKALNESVMPSFTLGLANPANLGINSPFGAFQEAKKMAKKKMIGDEEESGDGEMVPPASEKDEPDVDVDMGDDDMDDVDDAGCNKCSRMSRKKSKKKMWSDEDDVPVDDSDEEDEDVEGDVEDADSDVDDAAPDEDDEDEEGGEDLADKGGMSGMGGMGKAGPMFSKKSKKKCGADMGGEGKEEPDEGDVDMQFSKKKSKKNLKKEETEDSKWWNSVKNMVASNPNEKFSDGWTEYQSAEFTPIDTDNLTQAVRTEPQPGDVGFAPQQMGGSFFSN